MTGKLPPAPHLRASMPLMLRIVGIATHPIAHPGSMSALALIGQRNARMADLRQRDPG